MKLYVQPEESEHVILVCGVGPEAAVALLEVLKISAYPSRTFAIMGFIDGEGRYMEFVRVGEDRYLVRYEASDLDIAAVGFLDKKQAFSCLESFFENPCEVSCLDSMERI